MSKIDTKQAELSLADVEENNRRVRASASPKMQTVMDQVQSAIDDENNLMDQRLAAENQLREWAARLFGVALDISEIETVQDKIKSTPPGQVFIFTPKRPNPVKKERVSVIIYKTAFGTVDRLDSYIFALEKTIVDLSNRASPVKEQHTELSFLGLIKLAFTRLLNRSK